MKIVDGKFCGQRGQVPYYYLLIVFDCLVSAFAHYIAALKMASHTLSHLSRMVGFSAGAAMSIAEVLERQMGGLYPSRHLEDTAVP